MVYINNASHNQRASNEQSVVKNTAHENKDSIKQQLSLHKAAIAKRNLDLFESSGLIHKTSFAEKKLYNSITDNLAFLADTEKNKELKYQDENSITKETESATEVPLFDFDKVAENVLSFISTSILRAKERGADDEALTNMFEQARQGVETGIGEAITQLKEQDILNDDINEGITKSKDLIDQGIDSIYEQVFPEPIKPLTPEELEQQENRLSLMTSKGKPVDIIFVNKNDKAEFTPNRSDDTRVVVQGEMSESDKTALNQLIAEVKNLQKSFYEQNLGSAIEKELLNPGKSISPLPQESASNNTLMTKKYSKVAHLGDEVTRPEEKEKQRDRKSAIDFISEFNEIKSKMLNLFKAEKSDQQMFYSAIIKAEYHDSPEQLAKKLNNWQQISSQL